jgi:hypothetical protein
MEEREEHLPEGGACCWCGCKESAASLSEEEGDTQSEGSATDPDKQDESIQTDLDKLLGQPAFVPIKRKYWAPGALSEYGRA